MDNMADIFYFCFEDTVCRRVCNHQCRQFFFVFFRFGTQVVHVYISLLVACAGDGYKPCLYCRCRIRSVPLDEKHKNEQNLIEGCQSRVWLQCDYADGRLVFTADSDALITKGIIALLIRVISGHTPQEILDADLYFIEKIGLRQHLSPTRSNGLLSMVKQIKSYAIAYKAKEEMG